MLGAEAFDELTMWFAVMATPTLLNEIISNLQLTNQLKKGRRLPIDVLQSISHLLSGSHTIVPASFRKLAIGNIAGREILMNGVTVPMDTSAANVHGDGRMFAVDGTKDQKLFAAWARGEFSEIDSRTAVLWKESKNNLNMQAIGEQVKPFAKRIAGNAKSLKDVVMAVDAFMADPNRKRQINLCKMAVSFLFEEPGYARPFEMRSLLQSGLLFRDFAPYASSILRIYLVFNISLGLGFVRRDANSLADIQYLFYAPFCTGFCSNDKLHERLFLAATSSAIYLPAETLKADLLNRKAWRQSLGKDGWAKHRHEYGIYPMEFQGSLINEVWNRTMHPRPETPHRVTRESLDAAQNDPRIWEMVDQMKAMVKKSETMKRAEKTAWPHGKTSDGERPF